MKVDQLRGKWLQFKGEVKKQWGKLIDDDLRQIEGNYEKVIGMLQQRYGGDCVRLVRERYGGEKHELIPHTMGLPVATTIPAGSREREDVSDGKSSNKESRISD